jgi:hypothetical protein
LIAYSIFRGPDESSLNALSSFEPMALKKKTTIIARWPVAIIAFGITLTVIWICVLVWLPLWLLDML